MLWSQCTACCLAIIDLVFSLQELAASVMPEKPLPVVSEARYTPEQRRASIARSILDSLPLVAGVALLVCAVDAAADAGHVHTAFRPHPSSLPSPATLGITQNSRRSLRLETVPPFCLRWMAKRARRHLTSQTKYRKMKDVAVSKARCKGGKFIKKSERERLEREAAAAAAAVAAIEPVKAEPVLGKVDSVVTTTASIKPQFGVDSEWQRQYNFFAQSEE